MIDVFSIRDRNSEYTDLSGNQSRTQKSALPEISFPQNNIVVSSCQQNLENLIKAQGDCIEINPETERIRKDTDQRREILLTQKGKQKYKVTFRDQIPGQSLKEIKYYIKEPPQDLDECCPCKIF
ncbi:unnamed protein product (macronuclear) [Paramecium tetraurelia]|uniref:Uncharacterized protein n=1 Tax=Paramecium tetraurelia TaxID=5888 RepID=A0BCI3_PARTE|nr:uncharacterized protein GSPATT00004344001 [Paramecium tetraurelia]CAK56250.1 unnamed protein product [Paramecium tetraurelia]|eukprot:XP_001423648.1 hypothetical protein (macronuclear) [Paramecium tetraurelia strain d4-2]